MLHRYGVSVSRVAEVLSRGGLLDDDRVPAFESWLKDKLVDLAPDIAADVRAWIRALQHGGPRSHPRHPNTVRRYLRPIHPVLIEGSTRSSLTREPRRAAHPTQTAKNEVGLDQYQVRGYRAWYAHITLAMLVAAYLAATRTGGRKGGSGPGGSAGRSGLIPVSSNEIRRLLAALVLEPVACMSATITWSNWRRRRQHHARACHYRRRGHRPP